jgi:hypothetical protein
MRLLGTIQRHASVEELDQRIAQKSRAIREIVERAKLRGIVTITSGDDKGWSGDFSDFSDDGVWNTGDFADRGQP